MQAKTKGRVEPGFGAIHDAFNALMADGNELGAGFAVFSGGRCVAELWGGHSDRKRTRAWQRDTIVPVYSVTKAVAALVLARQLERSAFTYETPVADVWPAFAAAGKATATIGELLSHQAGLPGFAEPVDPGLWLEPEPCAEALAALPPMWPPGTAHGYHPLSWGYLAGAVSKRLDEGRLSLGGRLAADWTGTGQDDADDSIDFRIGLPAAEHGRCAEIRRPRGLADFGEITAETRAAFLEKWSAPDRGGALWREIEIPSANGHGTARGLAELFSVYAGGGRLRGRQMLSAAGFEALSARRASGPDRVLPGETTFAAGVMRNDQGLYGPNPDSFAHSGWGGSMAVADPDAGLALAYVTNGQNPVLQADPRAVALMDAAYASL